MNKGKLEVKIISPSETVYEGSADALSFPGRSGRAQILKGHARMTSLAGRGTLFISGPNMAIEIEKGVVFVDRDKVQGLIRLGAAPELQRR